jgi:hypothetical protein
MAELVEVVEDCGASQVEQVLALADEAGTVSLDVAQVGQGVLHIHPLAQLLPAKGRELFLAQLKEQSLIGVDGDSVAPAAGSAAFPQAAASAGGLREMHHSSRLEGLLIWLWQVSVPCSKST